MRSHHVTTGRGQSNIISKTTILCKLVYRSGNLPFWSVPVGMPNCTSGIAVACFTPVRIVGKAVILGSASVAVPALDETLASTFAGDFVAAAIVDRSEGVASGSG